MLKWYSVFCFFLFAASILGHFSGAAFSPKLRSELIKQLAKDGEDDLGCLVSTTGREYTGTVNVTETGLTCQRWDLQTPHKHHHSVTSFPELDLSKAENYCRNPTNEKKPWCYTITDTLYDWCDIEPCREVSPVAGFKGYGNIHIKGLNVYVHKEVTLDECAEKCLNHWVSYNKYACVSFDYDVTQQKCFLSDRNFDNIQFAQSVVFKKGVDHYERLDVDVCDVETSVWNSCIRWFRIDSWLQMEERCQQAGCCFINNLCYMSKTSVPAEIPCDEACKQVIDNVINTFSGTDFNDALIEASLKEAQTFLPDIPNSFWKWLAEQRVIAEALTVVKWPVDPKLVENLYELVSGFGTAVAEQYPQVFIGVSYSMVSNGVKNRQNTDSHYAVDAFLTSKVLQQEGLNEEEIQVIQQQEDDAAKAALQITAKQAEKQHEDILEQLYPCKNAEDWVFVAGKGDHMELRCYDMAEAKDVSLDECKKQSCLHRGNAFSYDSDELKCNIAYCRNGKIRYNIERQGVELWILKKGYTVSPEILYQFDSSTDHSFNVVTVTSLEECVEECTKRLVCASAGYDGWSEYGGWLGYDASSSGVGQCHLYSKVSEEPNNQATEYFVKTSETNFLKCQQKEVKTKGGNSDGQKCIFPFIYKDKIYTQCTLEDRDNYWCATYSYYDYHKKWGECIIDTANGGDECLVSADEHLTFDLLHPASDNKVSHCYKIINKTEAIDLEECLLTGYARKVNMVQFRPGDCQIIMCYTQDLAITTTEVGEGYDIYRDHTMLFDEGKPPSWEREHVSYLQANIWSDFASYWADICDVNDPSQLKFPPREECMNGFDYIQFLLSRRYEYTNFPTLSSPWPLVALIWPEASRRECNYVWSILYHNVAPVYNSKYTSDYKKVECNEASWYPRETIPRIISDGGVSGRQSTLSEQTYRCMGIPAHGVRQPGHRALIYYEYDESIQSSTDPTVGPFRLQIGQSIDDSAFNTNAMYVRTTFEPTGKSGFNSHISVDFFRGIAASINNGYKNFIKGYTAMALHNRAPPEQKDATLGLIVEAIKINPHMIHLWEYYLEAISSIRLEGLDFDRYATKCPSGQVYEKFYLQVWELAKQNLRKVVIRNDHKVTQTEGFPVTYVDVILRHYAPAPCCKKDSEANRVLAELIAEADSTAEYFPHTGENQYMKSWLEMNAALCKAHAGKPWSEILARMVPVSYKLVIEEFMSIRTMTDFIENKLIPVKGGSKTDKQAIADFINFTIMDQIPQIVVRDNRWFITEDYMQLSIYLQDIYFRLQDMESLNNLVSDVADLKLHSHGTDLEWWKEMVNNNHVTGDYQGILDGTIVWDDDQLIFVSSDKLSRTLDLDTRTTGEDMVQKSEEEVQAIERELKEKGLLT